LPAFRADGVIVSTPTGSTAYTLAANGPILTPDVDAMVVTPICPHLLTLRPIVVRGDARLTVRVEGIPNLALLTVDGQQAVELLRGDELRCHKSSFTVKLVRLSEGGFFEALRSKLSGESSRETVASDLDLGRAALLLQFGQQHFGLGSQSTRAVNVARSQRGFGLLDELADMFRGLLFLVVQSPVNSFQSALGLGDGGLRLLS